MPEAMSSLKAITIAGGGLAGLTLGIGLRQRGVPVTLWEAGHYPRHKVCGEFISGGGQEVLQRLGLTDLLEKAGATLARSARFFLGNAVSPMRPVQPAAICLSRFTLDRVLAESFQNHGGELRENARWEGSYCLEGIVRATGRRVQALENGWRWFGLKVHARGVKLDADLEMHGSANAYVGLCRLPDDETNICGLFRARPGNCSREPMELLRGPAGTRLHQRLAAAIFDETSFCSVAGLPLLPQRAVGQPECRIGDCLTMIPPATGNGMSMAFEAAELHVEPLLAYASGESTWGEACHSAAANCDSAFRHRLIWAKLLQRMMFSQTIQGWLGKWVLSSPSLWQLIFTRTR